MIPFMVGMENVTQQFREKVGVKIEKTPRYFRLEMSMAVKREKGLFQYKH